jgi:hypothetical protein
MSGIIISCCEGRVFLLIWWPWYSQAVSHDSNSKPAFPASFEKKASRHFGGVASRTCSGDFRTAHQNQRSGILPEQ